MKRRMTTRPGARSPSLSRSTPPTFRAFPLELKKLADEGTFEGYASTFGGPPDSHGDVLDSNAFNASLAEHERRQTWPAMLWAHRTDAPIGEWDRIAPDAKGLRVRGRLWIDGDHPVPEAIAAYRLMKARGKAGLSIGFRAIEATFEEDGVRVLRTVDLAEVSVVVFPACSTATVDAVKAANTVHTIRDFERWLRDAGGYSRGAAAEIATKGYAALAARDGPGADPGELAARDAHEAAQLLAALEARGRVLTDLQRKAAP